MYTKNGPQSDDRKAGLQAMGGAAVGIDHWELCEATAYAILGVYLHPERLGANGEVPHTDDTPVRICSCLKEDPEGVRSTSDSRRRAPYSSNRSIFDSEIKLTIESQSIIFQAPAGLKFDFIIPGHGFAKIG